MITYDNLLSIKELNNATVLAGKDGLNRNIRWCHVIYGSNIDEWLKSDSLLIITGLGLQDIENDLLRILRQLDNCDGAGIIISFSSHIKKLPESVLSLANDLRIPFIVLPNGVTIAEFTYSVGRMLFAVEKEKSMDDTLREIICFPYHDDMKHRLEQFGYDDRYQFVTYAVYVDYEDEAPASTLLMRDKIINCFCKLSGYARSNILSYDDNADIYFIVPFSKDEPKREAAKKLAIAVKDYIASTERGVTLRIGIGSDFSDLRDLKESATHAKHALQMLHVCDRKNDVRMHEDMGIYRIFFRCLKEEFLIELNKRILGSLAEHDTLYNSDLVNTLECFLDCNCNIGLTADQLYIHRNTLKYRIKKIQDILLIDFSDVNKVFTLQMAFKIKKYVNHISPSARL